MHVVLEAPANALDLCKDGSKVVVAGRSVFKIFSVEEEFVERDNLRVGKNINLNFSCNDVVWSPVDDQVIATAATNGAVVVWNLNKAGRAKQKQVFNDHRRTVNKVNFHPTEAGLLISGSQDGTMKLFDMRIDKPGETFESKTESVRDVQFNPLAYYQFCAVSENGKVQLWDTRRPDRCEKHWPAHNNHVFACDWHPELRSVLATAGRDKTIKVWDTMSRKGDKMHGLDHTVNTIGPVGRVKWRPGRRDYLGSSALCIGKLSLSRHASCHSALYRLCCQCVGHQEAVCSLRRVHAAPGRDDRHRLGERPPHPHLHLQGRDAVPARLQVSCH